MERLGIIMDKEQIREYTARISQSNKSGLVTIIYELLHIVLIWQNRLLIQMTKIKP